MRTANYTVQPMAAPVTGSVEVVPTTMHIHDLSIEQPAVVAYLQAIDPRNQEIALVHGIQVGITELVARRARARAQAAGPNQRGQVRSAIVVADDVHHTARVRARLAVLAEKLR
jgi:hypothetical protein